MPESTPPVTNEPEKTHSSPTTGATGTAPAPDPLQEFRYAAGPGIPEYLVGRTATEAARLMQDLHQQIVYSQPQQQQQAPRNYDADDTDSAIQKYVNKVRQNELQPAFQQTDAALTQQARALGALTFPDEFRRWAPEIDLYINQFGAKTPQSVAVIVDMVRGRHVSELAKEATENEIKRRIDGGTLRPQGPGGMDGGPENYRVDFETLPPGYRRVLQNLNITSETVDQMLRACYPDLPIQKAREKWVKLAQKGDVITDGRRFEYEGDANG
jgi:hypothetical protein